MLGKKEAPAFDKVDTILGKGISFTGTISGKGTIRVEGQVHGGIHVDGDVYIAIGAEVEAQISARHMTVAGTVVGDVELSGRLELGPTANLHGDVKVAILSVGEGAVFKGGCEMRLDERNGDNNIAKPLGVSTLPPTGKKAKA